MKANLAAAALIIGALGAVSCAGPRVIPATQPTPTPAPPRPPTAIPVAPAANWIDNSATPGDWQWSQDRGQSVASFAAGRLVLRCDPASRTVRIERSERIAPPPSGTVAMTIRTSGLTRAFTASVQSGLAAVSLPARDPLLDALAFSKGRFAVEATGYPPLYGPSWTEVSRVVEDCR